MAGQQTYPNDRGYLGSATDSLPKKGDLITCTLVLNNKFFDPTLTTTAVKNPINAVRKNGLRSSR